MYIITVGRITPGGAVEITGGMPKEYGTALTGSSQFDLTLPGSALIDRFDRSMGAGHQYHYKRMLPYLKRQGTITIVAFYDYRYFHTANLMVKTE